MPDLVVALTDIDRHSQLKMSATKPEVKLNFKPKEMAKRFQRLRTHILDHARCGTADTARHPELKLPSI